MPTLRVDPARSYAVERLRLKKEVNSYQNKKKLFDEILILLFVVPTDLSLDMFLKGVYSDAIKLYLTNESLVTEL